MRKNWLSAPWTHEFRAQPVVPDAAFQGAAEPYPGHWRRFPEPWPAAPEPGPAALAHLTNYFNKTADVDIDFPPVRTTA